MQASLCMHACSHFVMLFLSCTRVTASLVVAETELLMAVVRQHISVANSAHTPIVTAVNNILLYTCSHAVIDLNVTCIIV